MKVYILTKTNSQFLGRDFTLTGVTNLRYNIATQCLVIKNKGRGAKGTRSYSIHAIEVVEITEEVSDDR